MTDPDLARSKQLLDEVGWPDQARWQSRPPIAHDRGRALIEALEAYLAARDTHGDTRWGHLLRQLDERLEHLEERLTQPRTARITLTQGETMTFRYQNTETGHKATLTDVRDAMGQPVTDQVAIDAITVTWATSDPNEATIGTDGTLSILGPVGPLDVSGTATNPDGSTVTLTPDSGEIVAGPPAAGTITIA